MTTYVNDLPTMRDFFAAKVHSHLIKKGSERKRVTRGTAVLNGIVRVVLHLAGFGLLTMAGFQFNIIAGLTVAAVSCFALSTLMTRNGNGETEVNRAPDLRTGR